MRSIRLPLVLAVAACAAWGCNQPEADTKLVAGGQAYLAQCAVCHGPHGGGDGPLAASIAAEGRTRPARLDDAVRMGDLGHEGVRLAIEGGAHSRPKSPMPVWGPHLGPPWMDRIAAYVSTLPHPAAGARAAVDGYLESPAGTPEGSRRTYVLYCSGCHGPEGRGDGFFSEKLAKQMTPAALDGKRLALLTDPQLEEVIGMGGAHAVDAATMPGWIHTIAPAERRAVAAYIRTLVPTGTAP